MGTTQSTKSPNKVRKLNSLSNSSNGNTPTLIQQRKEQNRKQTIEVDQQHYNSKVIDIENPLSQKQPIENMSFSDPKTNVSGSSTIKNQNASQEQSSKSYDSNLIISSDVTIIESKKQKLNDTPTFDDTQIFESLIIAEQLASDLTIFQSLHHPNEEIAKLYQGHSVLLTDQKILQIYSSFGPYRTIDVNYPIFEFPDACYYIGQWHKKLKHGFGIYLTKQFLYEGNWFDDQYQGEGRIIYANGNYYKGEFYKGEFNGFGSFKIYNGVLYEGEWANGLKNGMGKEQYMDGTLYVGQFINNLKHGPGKSFNTQDDSVLEGEWQNGKPIGIANMTWSDGRKYTGEWVDGKMHGQGEFFWPGNKRYSGSYVNNVREGYGEYFWNDGKIYKGMWKNGLMHGQGLIIYPNNSHMKGMWNKGVKMEDLIIKKTEKKKKKFMPQ